MLLPDFQSALRPRGPQAGYTSDLFWFALAVSAVVLALVVGFLAAALVAHRRRAGEEEPGERQLARAVGLAIGGTVVVLAAWLVMNVVAMRGLSASPPRAGHDPGSPLALADSTPLVIEVQGQQWWWEVTYDSPSPPERLTTANEIHVPVGRPVVLRLSSRDVIHSLWVPNLAGKRDLIPGHEATLRFRADTAGIYRGQCAEFCGLQHANMALLVVAEPPARFVAWYAGQLRPADVPADSSRRMGQTVFAGAACSLCHTVRGTPASGRVAPDLTHLGSRRTLAAGTLPNTRGHLAGWILNPDRLKPGVHMPPTQLRPGELRALLDYLEGLR